MTSKKLTLYSVLTRIGALVAFVFRFSIVAIGSRQHFSMATNFMRKIYSVEGKDKGGDDDDDDDDYMTKLRKSNLNNS